MTLKGGEKVHYVYEKNLPEDVKEDECSYKVGKMFPHFLSVAWTSKFDQVLLLLKPITKNTHTCYAKLLITLR